MIVLAYDHRAYNLMLEIKKYLNENKMEYVEFASKEYDALDSYSEFAKKANEYIINNKNSVGIYSCRTGIGISMAANRQKGIRAGLCFNDQIASLARNDDDINVLVLPAEYVDTRQAINMIDIFLKTPFEGGRHIKRVELLDK